MGGEFSRLPETKPMRRFFALVPLLVCFLPARSVDAARASVPSLHTGDVFPQFSGETLAGKTVTLPAAGTDMVLVFSFSRKAAEDVRVWSEHLSNDPYSRIPVYGIIEMESAPKLFRGMAVAGIRSSTPTSVQSRTIVLYRDENLWEERLSVSDRSRAYVVLLEPNGRIRWMNSGAFTDAEVARLQHALLEMLRLHP